MATYAYYSYDKTLGGRRDTKLNKQIISIARRNKFYYKIIKLIIEGDYGNPTEIIVAKIGDKPVGFIIFWCEFHRRNRFCCDLQYWIVDEKYRNRGIGGKLYSMMEERAETEYGIYNYSVMYNKDDDRLKQLYESKGYKFIPTYDGGDTQREVRDDKHIKHFKIKVHSIVQKEWDTDLILSPTDREKSLKT